MSTLAKRADNIDAGAELARGHVLDHARRSVTRNKNRSPVMMRLRLGMLVPVSARCS